MTIGKRISALRQQRKLSQEYLAEQMGVTRQAVSKWENDQTAPDTNNLVALADFFEVSVDYLATGRMPQTAKKPYDPTPLLGIALVLFAAAFILWVLSWPFDPRRELILYVIFHVLRVLSIIAAVVLVILYKVLRKKQN